MIQLVIVDAVSELLFGRDSFNVEGPTPTKKTLKNNDTNDNSNEWPEQAPVSFM